MFAAAATYWLLGGGGAALVVLVNLWLSQKVKIPETTRAMMNAEASRRVITLHLY
jgi:hypothetical protein